MKYEELKALRQEGVELGKKGLFQDAQIKLYRAFNGSEDFTEFHLEVGLDLVCVYRRMESYSAAFELVDYVASSDYGSDYYVSLAYLERAILEYNQRDYEKALETLNEAEALFDESFPLKKFWYLASVKGQVLLGLGQPKDAIEAYMKALELCRHSANDRQLQKTYHNLGTSYISLGDIDTGVSWIKKSMELDAACDDLYSVAINHQTLMYACLETDDLTSAKKHASECLRISYENGYRAIVRDACYQIGRYYKAHGNPVVADVFFKKASNADNRISAELLKELDIDIINSRGSSLGEE